MSEQTYDLDDELDEDEAKPNWRRKLEREAREGKAATQQAQDAKKELAFYKAGLPMEDPRMAYFVKGYDGEFSADAIRKAATDAGFIKPAAQDTAIEDEVQQHQQFTDASAGASVTGKLTQSDVLDLARKAADSAPSGQEAAAYHRVLTEHGLARMRRPPEG